MNNNNNNGNLLSDILSLLSLYLQVLNLEENEQQNRKLDEHLHNQDSKFLQKAIEQNEIIIQQNEEIIRLLKEK